MVLACPTCPKMSYKLRNFIGMEILCPFTRRYQLYDKRVRDLIEEKGYARLEADATIPDLEPNPYAIFDFDLQLNYGTLPYVDARELFQEPLRFEKACIELAFQLGPILTSSTKITYV